MMRRRMTSDIEKRWKIRAEKGNWAWAPEKAETSKIDGVSKSGRESRELTIATVTQDMDVEQVRIGWFSYFRTGD